MGIWEIRHFGTLYAFLTFGIVFGGFPATTIGSRFRNYIPRIYSIRRQSGKKERSGPRMQTPQVMVKIGDSRKI